MDDKKLEQCIEKVSWLGKFVEVHEIGDLTLIEYIDKQDNATKYHVFGTSTTCNSFDKALLLVLGAKYLDVNDAWRFADFAERMLKMESKEG